MERGPTRALELRIIGCGDAFGSGGRFNTCFLIDCGDWKALVDCGASSLVALKQAGENPDDLDVVAISHLHGDHFGGLVFLLREATLYKSRTRPLTIIGPRGIEARLQQAMEAFFPSGWQVPSTFSLSILELHERVHVAVGPFQVVAFAAEHFSGAPSYSLRIEIGGTAISYSGDTLWSPELEAAADDADLFLCECYSYSARRGTHIDYGVLKSNASRLTAHRVVLTHLGPDMLEKLEEVERQFTVASDGLRIPL